MRVNKPLNHILNNEAKIVCLRFLCNYPTDINGTQLAKLVGLTPATVHKAMKELFNEQIVNLKGAGNSHLYELNKKNVIVTEILFPMFKREKRFFEEHLQDIKRLISRSPFRNDVVSAALFGSVPEKRERPTSDTDLFIVLTSSKNKKKMEDYIISTGLELLGKFGLLVEPYIKTLRELKRDQNLNVVKSIYKSHLLVFGKRLEALL